MSWPTRKIPATQATPLQSVEDPNGETDTINARGQQVLDANDADMATAALETVITSGTGTNASIGRPAAGKTGTNQEYRDAWFCGYVPQLATCVWVGHAEGQISMTSVEGFSPVYGGTIPALIWHDFMTAATDNWVNTAGDTMTGNLFLSGSANNTLLSAINGSGAAAARQAATPASTVTENNIRGSMLALRCRAIH